MRSLRFVLQIFGILVICISSAVANPSWSIPIFVYHRFDPLTSGPMTIRTTVLAEQLAWLKAHDVTVLPLHEVVDKFKNGKIPIGLPAVVLTADDGHLSVYSEMYPLIRRYGVHVTLFIYPSAISNAKYALTWEELEEMVKSGLIDVQSHTYWHPNFDIERRHLAPEAYAAFVKTQLFRSRDRLEERLGIKVDLLAWPFGISDAELKRQAAEAGYVAAFSIDRKPLRAGADVYALPRYQITDADRGERFAALVLSSNRQNVPQ